MVLPLVEGLMTNVETQGCQQRPEPYKIAAKIVEWYPNGAFTYDTYCKLKRDIATAIETDRKWVATG